MPRKIRDTSAVVSSVSAIWAMMMAVSPFSRDVARGGDELAWRSRPTRASLVELLGQVDDQRVGDDQRPLVAAAIHDHVAPVAGPVLAELRVGQQPLDGSLALVGEGSSANAVTCSGVGNSPIRSSDTRRRNVSSSTSGSGGRADSAESAAGSAISLANSESILAAVAPRQRQPGPGSECWRRSSW